MQSIRGEENPTKIVSKTGCAAQNLPVEFLNTLYNTTKQRPDVATIECINKAPCCFYSLIDCWNGAVHSLFGDSLLVRQRHPDGLRSIGRSRSTPSVVCSAFGCPSCEFEAGMKEARAFLPSGDVDATYDHGAEMWMRGNMVAFLVLVWIENALQHQPTAGCACGTRVKHRHSRASSAKDEMNAGALVVCGRT